MPTDINWEEVSPDDCEWDGTVWPEHDYDDNDMCRRCGAETHD